MYLLGVRHCAEHTEEEKDGYVPQLQEIHIISIDELNDMLKQVLCIYAFISIPQNPPFILEEIKV